MKSLEEIKPFFEYLRSKKPVAENTTNSWVAALNAIAEHLETKEQTSEFILNNRDLIKNRFQNANHNVRGETIDIYLKRACAALSHFAEWQKDRSAWEKNIAAKSAARPASRPKASGKDSGGAERNASADHYDNSESAASGNWKTNRKLPIPTGNGGVFMVDLPESYTMNDLVRVLWALAVYATDFDPATVLQRYGAPPAPGAQPGRSAPSTPELPN